MMKFNTRQEGSAIVVTLSGRLDGVTAEAFEKEIRGLIDGGAMSLVLDLDELDYVSSAGIRGIMIMAKLMKEKNGQVCLANLKGNVRSVFDMCGITPLFKVQDSVAGALGALA